MTDMAPDFAALLASLGSERFRTLRSAQAEVLERYALDHLESADVAVEMPTGAGKSLVALLIGEYWRRGGRTVAVLTGNKALAVQMEREGQSLGVPLARMEGRGEDIPLSLRRHYRRAQAIGVMNYWVMFNANPVVDSADLLIVDDAHLAEGALVSGFSVQIDRASHPQLFAALVEDLAVRLPDYASLEDARSDASNPRAGVELMAYLDQDAVASRLRELVDGAGELHTDLDLRLRWRDVRERLAEMNVYLSRRTIMIRPYCPPTQTLPRWSDPTQRLYLSATIGDPADLQRRLGSRSIAKIASIDGAPTLGRRMIVLNNDFQAPSDTVLPARMGAVILAALRRQPKALWLCASKAQADAWMQTVLPWLAGNGLPISPAWTLGRQGDEIEQFRSAPSGHLFVGGRFDGMDFADGECRLAIVAALPRAVNDQEQFVSDYLRDAEFLIGRTNQRIVQALGRCNRSDDDFAVYVLADRRFAAHLSQESNRRGLPAAVQAELDIAEELDELDDAQLLERVTTFLDQDFTPYDELFAELAAEVPAPAEPPADSADDEVAGWLALAGRQDYLEAEARFAARQHQLGELGVRELGAFHQYCEAKAAHLEGQRGDVAAAQRSRTALEQAIARGGASSSWFNRLRASAMRAGPSRGAVVAGRDDFRAATIRAFDEQLEVTPPGPRLDRWRTRLAADLASHSHDRWVQGFARIGQLMGYSTVSPRYGAATDCRWRGVFGNAREAFTFEAKIEHGDATEISAHAVGQAHNQRARAFEELGPAGYTVRGLIVTHLERLAPDAAASLGDIVVLRRAAVTALHERIRELLTAYAASWSLESPQARVAAGEALALQLPDTGWLVAAIDAADRFLEDGGLLAGWP